MGNRTHRPSPQRWPAKAPGESVVLSVHGRDRDRVSALLPFISHGPVFRQRVLDCLMTYSDLMGSGRPVAAGLALHQAEEAAQIGP
jgi:hypothetical protein